MTLNSICNFISDLRNDGPAGDRWSLLAGEKPGLDR